MKREKSSAPSFLGALRRFRLECAKEIEFLDSCMKNNRTDTDNPFKNPHKHDVPKDY